MKLKEGVSLADLAEGSIIEKANDAIAEVARNILDPNTEPDSMRSVTIKLKIKPSKSRDIAAITVGVETKLAQARPAESMLFLSQTSRGEIVVSERDTKQTDLFTQEKEEEDRLDRLQEADERKARMAATKRQLDDAAKSVAE